MYIHEMCKKIASLKLVQASSGNYSQKCVLDSDVFYITSSGSWFEEIEKSNIVTCLFSTKKPKNNKVASSELPMHIEIYKNRQNILGILHYQPVYGTIISCANNQIEDFNIIPEIVYYIKGIEYVPYYKPGSFELAKIVGEKMKLNDIVIMKNHGLVVVGQTQEEILRKAIFFELACEILVKSCWKLDRIKK